MAMTQFDIPDKLNKKLIMYRIQEDMKNKEELIINILEKFFEND